MRVLRSLILVIILVSVVSLAAFGALLYLIDPNRLKPMLISTIRAQTGYAITIDGKLTWTIYPIGVNFPIINLFSPGATMPFAIFHQLKISVPFSQLFNTQSFIGSLVAKELILDALHFNQVTFQCIFTQDKLKIPLMQALFYGGVLKASVEGSGFKHIPIWHIQVVAHDVNEMAAIKLIGSGNFTVQAKSMGADRNTFLQQLEGVGQFQVRNGAVLGINVADLIGLPQRINPAPLETPFSTFTGAVMIKNGVLTTQQWLLVSEMLMARAEGSVNLITQTVDYQWQFTSTDAVRSISILATGDVFQPFIRLAGESIHVTNYHP